MRHGPLWRFIVGAAAVAVLAADPPQAPAPTPAPTPTPTPSSVNYPTNRAASMPAASQTARNSIVNKVTAEEWNLFPDDLTGVFFTQTFTVSSASAFLSATTTILALPAYASSKFLILVDDGTDWADATKHLQSPNNYDSDANGYKNLQFTTGGLLVMPKPGANPLIQGQIQSYINGVEWRGLTFCRAENTAGTSNDWVMDIGADFYAPSNLIPALWKARMVFNGCNVGSWWNPDPNKSSVANVAGWSNGLSMKNGWQLIIKNCKFRRCSRGFNANNVRIVHTYKNDISEVCQVWANIHELFDGRAVNKGIYADDDNWVWIERYTHRGPPNDPAIGGVHLDFCQRSRQTAMQNGQPSNIDWATKPPGGMRLLIECGIGGTDVNFSVDSVTGLPAQGSGGRIIPALDLFIDSDWQPGDPHARPDCTYVIQSNLHFGTGFLAQPGASNVHIFFNTSTGVPQVASDFSPAYFNASNQIYVDTAGQTANLNIGGNLCRTVSVVNGTFVTGGIANVAVNDDDTNTAAGNRPQDFLVGPWLDKAPKWGFNLVSGFAQTQAAYNDNLLATYSRLPGVTAGV